MEHYFNTIWDSIRFSNIAMPSIGIRDILDIVIVAYLIYKMIFWIKETRAWVLFKGILVICIFALMCYILRLNTILWILSKTISVGIIAVIVVFQPELRKALEQLERASIFLHFSVLKARKRAESTQKRL